MQNRLLPLLCLLISSQAYSEDSITESPITTTQNDTQASSIPFESSQKGNLGTTEPNINPSEQTSTVPSEIQTSNDDGIDEELIAELLNEDTDTSSTTEEKTNKTPTTKQAEKSKKTPSALGSSTWLPEIEFGYRSEQGNDNERSLNTRLSLSYITGRLRNNGEIKVYMKNKDGEEDKREQTYQLQSDYKVSPKIYIYGNFKGIDSKYSSYFHDYTVSTGLGYQITNTDTLKIETELGPGYRYQEPNTDKIHNNDPIFPENVDEPIIRANLSASWKPFDNSSFNFNGTIVSGESNTRFDSEFSIINYISEDIALKISQTIEHLSRVPNHLEKTDTIFTINILYSPR